MHRSGHASRNLPRQPALLQDSRWFCSFVFSCILSGSLAGWLAEEHDHCFHDPIIFSSSPFFWTDLPAKYEYCMTDDRWPATSTGTEWIWTTSKIRSWLLAILICMDVSVVTRVNMWYVVSNSSLEDPWLCTHLYRSTRRYVARPVDQEVIERVGGDVALKS